MLFLVILQLKVTNKYFYTNFLETTQKKKFFFSSFYIERRRQKPLKNTTKTPLINNAFQIPTKCLQDDGTDGQTYNTASLLLDAGTDY